MTLNILPIVQIIVTVIVGFYFLTRLIGENKNLDTKNEDVKEKAEKLNNMRKISLTNPLTETVRPKSFSEIIGQQDAIRAIEAALCGKNPQHIIIYGPPGVGKTAVSRIAMERAKKSKGTPFKKDAVFIEADATIMRFDERSIADPLIGSVHDPIYQGAGVLGVKGIPEPKEGAVSKAHGGVLFLDEIGELHPMQLNKLLKVLEDRKVMFESSYYDSKNKNIPLYIHDIFKNGIPADFRLIGATTRKPSEIPEAIRSRCVEVFFNPLSILDIRIIMKNAFYESKIIADDDITDYLSLYAQNGRDAVKMVQTIINLADLEGEEKIELKMAKWVIESGRYKRRNDAYRDKSIINVSIGKER